MKFKIACFKHEEDCDLKKYPYNDNNTNSIKLFVEPPINLKFIYPSCSCKNQNKCSIEIKKSILNHIPLLNLMFDCYSKEKHGVKFIITNFDKDILNQIINLNIHYILSTFEFYKYLFKLSNFTFAYNDIIEYIIFLIQNNKNKDNNDKFKDIVKTKEFENLYCLFKIISELDDNYSKIQEAHDIEKIIDKIKDKMYLDSIKIKMNYQAIINYCDYLLIAEPLFEYILNIIDKLLIEVLDSETPIQLFDNISTFLKIPENILLKELNIKKRQDVLFNNIFKLRNIFIKTVGITNKELLNEKAFNFKLKKESQQKNNLFLNINKKEFVM